MALKAFTKTVSSASTAEALKSSATLASSVIVRAMEDNAGAVYVGDSAVSSSDGAIEPKASISFGGDGNVAMIDLNAIYVDAANSSDGVDVWYIDGSST